MSLIICPQTTQKAISQFTDKLKLQKISNPRFWHSNFNDNFYEGLDGLTKVIFTGYSGAVVGQSLIEYAKHYLREDKKKEAYFIGKAYAFRDSLLEPGDLVYAKDSFSPDSFEQAIYQNAIARGFKDFTLPDQLLLNRVLNIAKEKSFNFKPSKVYCRISPGCFPDFNDPMQLMNEAMWWKLALSPIEKNDCDSGEYESASFLACTKLLDIPAVALLYVKDKRYSKSSYRVASQEQQINALDSILEVIKESIL